MRVMTHARCLSEVPATGLEIREPALAVEKTAVAAGERRSDADIMHHLVDVTHVQELLQRTALSMVKNIMAHKVSRCVRTP